MSEFLLEVNDALRAKQIEAMWQKYGQAVIGVVVAAVIATSIGVAWNSHMNKVLAEDTDKFLSIMENKDEKALAENLATLSKSAHQPLKGLIDFILAQKQEESNDLKAAAKSYLNIANQSQLPEATRSLARLNYVRLGIVTGENPKSLMTAIEPLVKEKNGFHASALELKGLLLQEKGKIEEANAIFEGLASNSNVPGTLRQRAKALIQHEAQNAKK